MRCQKTARRNNNMDSLCTRHHVSDNTALHAKRHEDCDSNQNPEDISVLHVYSSYPLWVFVSEITRDCSVTDRTVRKWISTNRFPKPDGNLNGRCFWLRETYTSWQAKVRSGIYSKSSNLHM